MRSFNWCKRALLGVSLLTLPLLGYAQSSEWANWLTSQVQQHPDVLAAREQWLGVNARADATGRPLYNPELSTELERSGSDTNFRIGVQQTIDWWDKQDANTHQATYLRVEAEAMYRQQVLDKTFEALTALINWHSANEIASITQTQQKQLNKLLELVESRLQAGDLGSIDAELTFLSLSQQLAQAADVDAELRKTELVVRELLLQWTPSQNGIPDEFWPDDFQSIQNKELLKLPSVSSARARWQSMEEASEVARLSAKAEPTIGLGVGRDGGENALGLSFSMPWNIRNDYSADVRVANQAELEAEARFHSVYRKQQYVLQGAEAVWKSYDKQYRQWQSLVRGRLEKSAELLERQWRSGDLSTTDYLLALNQRSESLLAGIELEKQTRLAFAEVLKQSGYLLTEVVSAIKPQNQ